MNGKLFPRTVNSLRQATRRFRPTLDALEERTLLTVDFFYLDPATSLLTLSGDIGGNPIMQQGAGSLVTSYEGILEADYDLGANTINLSANSYAYANNSGSWTPRANGSAGSEPANYGGRVNFIGTANAAIRNLLVSAFSQSSQQLFPIGGGGYVFASDQVLYVYAGQAAYSHPILGSGSENMQDLFAVNQGSGAFFQDYGGGFAYMYLPVDVTLTETISGIEARLRIRGEINAYSYPGDGPDSGGSGGAGLDVAASVALGQAEVPVVAPTPAAPIVLDVVAPVVMSDIVPPIAPTAMATLDAATASAGLDVAALDQLWSGNWTF